MFLAGGRWGVVVIVVLLMVVLGGAQFTRVYVKTILALLGEAARKGEESWLQWATIKFSISLCTHLMMNVTMSSSVLWVTYLASFFSSMPFLCSVAIKSVSGRDMRNCRSRLRPAKISGSCKANKVKCSYQVTLSWGITNHQSKPTWCVMGMSPNSRVAFVGPHSPLAQSGRGTMTVCSSSQQIWK